MSSTRYAQILSTLETMIDNDAVFIGGWIPLEVYAAYAENLSLDPTDIESWQSEAEEAYAGAYDSDADFAQSMAEDLGAIPNDTPWPLSCIDWTHAARELMYDYFETEGYYFRNL